MTTLTALGATHGFTAGDLDTSGQVAVLPAYQKVYFADGRAYNASISSSGYHKLDFINTSIVGTVTGTFTQGEVVTQAVSGATGIFDENVGSGATAKSLIYRTTTTEFVAAQTITGADSGATVTPAAAGNIVAPPHWLNWTLSTGTFPDGGSNIMSLCWGRIFMNSVQHPHQWFATRVNNPLDLLLVVDDVASAQNSQATKKAGLVGDQLIAMIPYKGNTQVFGTANNMFVMRADPAKGGFFTTLSDTTGIFSNESYCWDDKNNLYFLGFDGIYALSAEAIINGLPPENLTKDHVPKLVANMGLNRRTDRVVMEYDKDRYGIVVSCVQRDGTWKAIFWMDLRTGGIFPENYSSSHLPTSLLYFNARTKAERTLLAGCADGYIRKWSETDKSDDGSTAIESNVLIGPVAGENIRSKVGMNEVSVKTGIDTDSITVALHSGITAEKAIKNVIDGEAPRVAKTFSTDKLLPSIRQNVEDGAVAVNLSNTTAASSWSMEKIDSDIEEVGRLK
jgi:hypothetical protein